MIGIECVGNHINNMMYYVGIHIIHTPSVDVMYVYFSFFFYIKGIIVEELQTFLHTKCYQAIYPLSRHIFFFV